MVLSRVSEQGTRPGPQACRLGLVRGQCTCIRLPDRQGLRILEAFVLRFRDATTLVGDVEAHGVDVTHISGFCLLSVVF